VKSIKSVISMKSIKAVTRQRRTHDPALSRKVRGSRHWVTDVAGFIELSRFQWDKILERSERFLLADEGGVYV